MTKHGSEKVVMINVHDAKTHLSRYLMQIQEGQHIILCRNGVPVAQLIPIDDEHRSHPARFGMAKGMGEVTEEFFEPLTKDDMPDVGL